MRKESVHGEQALFSFIRASGERMPAKPTGAVRRTFSADDRGTDKGQLPWSVRMLRAEHKLQGETLSQQTGGNVGGDNLTKDVGVFAGVVKSRENHGMGEAFGMLVHIHLDEMSHIVTDTDKGGRPADKMVQKGVQIPAVGKDVNASGQTMAGIDCEIVFFHAGAVALVAFQVCLGVIDIPQKTDVLVAVSDESPGDLIHGAKALDEDEISVQLMVWQGRNRIQKDLGKGKLVDHTQDLCVIDIQNHNAVHLAV